MEWEAIFLMKRMLLNYTESPRGVLMAPVLRRAGLAPIATSLANVLFLKKALSLIQTGPDLVRLTTIYNGSIWKINPFLSKWISNRLNMTHCPIFYKRLL